MRTLLFVLMLAAPGEKSLPLSTTVEDADLADTPATAVVAMEPSRVTNQISLTLEITPGTTTYVDVTCYESTAADSGFGIISFCDTQSPSGCKPDVRRFTLADYTADGSGVYWIATRWHVTKPYAYCTADDPADGTGTITITGTRSWQ